MIDLWLVIIAFLWTGYFVLEGFDFGVGMLSPFLGRNEGQRKQVLQTIGPVWDGNEVWLITAVGAMFAAFPAWYAGFLSSFYLPLTLVLAGLIVRGVALEWRGKLEHSSDRAWADVGIAAGSALPAFLWGAVFADVLLDSGVAALVGGAFSLAVCLLHGAVFLALRTEGVVRRRARAAAMGTLVAVIPLGIVALSSIPREGSGAVWIAAGTAMALLAAGGSLIWRRREGWAFAATAGAIALASAALFGTLAGAPMPGLTLEQAASGPYTLNVLTWIGLAILPFVLGYQGWTYWVFRKRISAPGGATQVQRAQTGIGQ
ncbi:cytochrome d ubiquinol oxidase subunit II [Nonomuraea dietziae]|uniref:Cytochrome d ubiquinol oxidase subunit II n=1 Tax=Nonomuraea dietziae TaxID=65515 RepID=A0A7W5VF50_9ACTN|nr:cytochrome d ubiquinol oxidase subunit II [Nonomuraea dietziae]MBB3726602.1 cytochrome d ubiquinol oxidase subunit II [Nonomuraea dietziae]